MLIALCLLLLSPCYASAGEDSNYLFTLGFGPGRNYSGNDVGFTPAFRATLERKLLDLDRISLYGGAVLGYSSSKDEFKYFGITNTYRWTNIKIAARGSFHYLWNGDRLDTYAGLSQGFRVVSFSQKDDVTEGSESVSTTTSETGIFVGASYALSEHFGLFAEAGRNFNIFALGFTIH